MRTAILVGLSLSFVGCANGTVDRDSGRLTRIDTGLSLVDAGPATLDSGGDAHLAMADAYSVEDAFSEVDAFAATDASTPMADAFTPTPDAFVPADAFVPVDAYTPDAYSPSGCVTPPASGADCRRECCGESARASQGRYLRFPPEWPRPSARR